GGARPAAAAPSTINPASDPTDSPASDRNDRGVETAQPIDPAASASTDGSAITSVVVSDEIISAEAPSAAKVGSVQGVPTDDRTVISSSPPALGPRGGSQSAAELGRLLIGEQLDHFLLEEYIGGGGMGAVFRGTDTMLGRQVAVKVLSRQHAIDEETTRRFRNEAQSAARLDHENIARVYFVGVDRGWHYIVLEYVEGENARDLVAQQGPLPLATVLDITLQVAESLQHAASRDVVHRDVKPSNVLVTSDGHVKLVDMGLARLRQVEQTSDDITATGVTLGTFDYISPEQARDPRAADVRSDLYSLGCTMYYMLCAQPPFPEGTVLQKLLQHQGDEAPDCRQLRGDIPDVVAAILRKLLAKNPQDRYQQPRDLIAELLVVCNELGIQLTRRRTAIIVPPQDDRSQGIQRHLPWMVPLALLVVAVLGIQIFGNRSGQLPMPPRPIPHGGGAVPHGGIAPVVAERGGVLPGEAKPGGGLASGEFSVGPVHISNAADSGSPGSQKTPQQIDSAKSVSAKAESGKTPQPPRNGDSKSIDGPIGPPPADRVAIVPGEPGLQPGVAVAPIVAITPTGQRSFATLAEACRQTPSGSVIELRYNGRREEQPIALSNRELTVRAAEGFHPIVGFRPEGADPLLSPHCMLSVTGGDLTMVNVELELRVPQRIRSEGWVLIEAVLADKVRLERCTLTVSGSAADGSKSAQDVSFMAVKAPPRRETGMMADEPIVDSPVSIELRNCIVRGDATVLSGNALHSVSLQWENGLLATNESLLDLRGTDLALPATTQVQINLQHVTARMRRGMCRITTREDERYLPLLRINCTDCILMTDGSPLIDQRGDEPAEEQQKSLLWKGNRNFYEGIEVFWQVDGPRTAGPTKFDWAAWRDHWGTGRETTERGASVAFARLPDPRSPKANQSPLDYLLDESEQYNPALGSATDGTADVGMKAELLPTLQGPTRKAPQQPPQSDTPRQDAPMPGQAPELKPTEPAEE
ncbi:MAG: protein kinase, partial [Planctomycetes bacterium]|nr:protein kinase [Planctomycetota bacterium]